MNGSQSIHSFWHNKWATYSLNVNPGMTNKRPTEFTFFQAWKYNSPQSLKTVPSSMSFCPYKKIQRRQSLYIYIYIYIYIYTIKIKNSKWNVFILPDRKMYKWTTQNVHFHASTTFEHAKSVNSCRLNKLIASSLYIHPGPQSPRSSRHDKRTAHILFFNSGLINVQPKVNSQILAWQINGLCE